MFLKNKFILILISIVILLVFSITILFKLYQSEKSDRKRYNDNMISLITNKNNQQSLSVKELKSLYPKYDSLAKELNIKTKYLTNIIDIKYRFRDSTITHTVLIKDSTSEKSYFNLNEKCYSLSGYIKNDSISFTEKTLNDNITTFLYKDWRKKYFFKLIKLKPFYTSKTYSECLKDTISVNNNIQIIH